MIVVAVVVVIVVVVLVVVTSDTAALPLGRQGPVTVVPSARPEPV